MEDLDRDFIVDNFDADYGMTGQVRQLPYHENEHDPKKADQGQSNRKGKRNEVDTPADSNLNASFNNHALAGCSDVAEEPGQPRVLQQQRHHQDHRTPGSSDLYPEPQALQLVNHRVYNNNNHPHVALGECKKANHSGGQREDCSKDCW